MADSVAHEVRAAPPGPLEEGRFARPEWVYIMLNASRLLTFGSALLLGGALAVLSASVLGYYSLLVFPFFLGFTMIGVVFHILAWVSLRDGVDESLAAFAIFVASIVAFAVGIAIVAIVSFGIRAPEEFFFWLLIGGYAMFPYSPPVYAPVTFAHALIFLIVTGRLRSKDSTAMIAIGAAILAVIAVVAVSLYVTFSSSFAIGSPLAPFSPQLGWTLPGLTALGYAFVGYGWFREYQLVMVRGPSRWFKPRG